MGHACFSVRMNQIKSNTHPSPDTHPSGALVLKFYTFYHKFQTRGMGVGRGMGVRHPLVKVGARAKIVIFLARVRLYTR